MTSLSKQKGYYFDKDKNKWRARVYVNGKYKHLGYFDTRKAAKAVFEGFTIEKAEEPISDLCFFDDRQTSAFKDVVETIEKSKYAPLSKEEIDKETEGIKKAKEITRQQRNTGLENTKRPGRAGWSSESTNKMYDFKTDLKSFESKVKEIPTGHQLNEDEMHRVHYMLLNEEKEKEINRRAIEIASKIITEEFNRIKKQKDIDLQLKSDQRKLSLTDKQKTWTTGFVLILMFVVTAIIAGALFL